MIQYENILFVPVEENSWSHGFYSDGSGSMYLSWLYSFNKGKVKEGICKLPSKSWSIIGTTDTLGDKEWGQVVESDVYFDGDPPGLGRVRYYRNYPNELDESMEMSATASGANLLQSLGITARCVVLVKTKLYGIRMYRS